MRDKPIELRRARVLSTEGVRTVILPDYNGVMKVDHATVAGKTMWVDCLGVGFGVVSAWQKIARVPFNTTHV